LSSKQDELRWHKEAYREFRSLVEEVDEQRFEDRWLDGRWGVREIVWHLAGWHRELSMGLERMGRGERPAPEGVDWGDVQHWNDIFAAEAQGKHKAQVLQELDDQVARFRNLAEQLPADRFGPGKTASRILDSTGTSHFRTHAAMIGDWLRERVA
jgi:hypothetical protein